jgi:hypothetical protein
MKISITIPEAITSDEFGTEYKVKSLYPSGKRVYINGQHAGWALWVGPILINVIRKYR